MNEKYGAEEKSPKYLLWAVVIFICWLLMSFYATWFGDDFTTKLFTDSVSPRELFYQNIVTFFLTLFVIPTFVAVGLPLYFMRVWRQKVGVFFAINSVGWSLFLWLSLMFFLLVLDGRLNLQSFTKMFSQNNGILLFWRHGVPALLIAMIFVQPVLEEFLFRGFIQSCLLKSLDMKLVFLLVSALWTAGHLYPTWVTSDLLALDMGGFVRVHIQFFSIGLLLSISRHYSNSLFTPIVLHVIYNAYAASVGG